MSLKFFFILSFLNWTWYFVFTIYKNLTSSREKMTHVWCLILKIKTWLHWSEGIDFEKQNNPGTEKDKWKVPRHAWAERGNNHPIPK